jgi:SpoVK/Ycf46/Vps4 family AAA+-type ATPase
LGYIEHKCTEDGIADSDQYMLTRKVKETLLANYKPSHSKCRQYKRRNDRFLKSHSAIKEKDLFFNASEQEQIDHLTSLLTVDNFPSIQQRLEEQGMRKGFACLFYGGPGTGKTETVLQIARQTGRDLMQVDIAGLRDKYVGESEKNIKQVFTRYRELCKNADVLPILFFNEADALINKRTENIEHSVDKMDNAMQNIILQEIEDLDGILIATTNLTSNLDKAFERRFLFKIEFHKPNTDVKAKIWRSMLKDISADDARQLASHFDFSGGQIENIARKRTIDYILSGKFATVDEIEKYCQAELLDNKKERKHISGFSN